MSRNLKPMLEISEVKGTSAEFQLAVSSLRQATLRVALNVTEIPSPANLATHAVAIAANVGAEAHQITADQGSGRFVLLHSEQPQEGWGGSFRVICYAKSPLETDIGSDEQITDVCWAWLKDSLKTRGAGFNHEAGTITRIISSGFGSIAGQSDHAELEIRASWSPFGDNFASHLEAWQDLLCMMSGLPPESGISRI